MTAEELAPAEVQPAPRLEATAMSAVRPRRPVQTVVVDAGLYIVVLVAVAVMAVPLIWLFLTSMKTPQEINTRPLEWLPGSPRLSNYRDVADTIPIGKMFLNSMILTTVGSALKVFLGLCCAYALVFVDVPFRKAAFVLVIFALLVPSQVTIIPNYTLVAELGWLNTYQGILVPSLASAFGTFLFRQHFLTLPISILEAAQLDGAGHWRRLWRFVVPMSMPTIAAVTLVSVVNEWNEYLWPRLIVDKPETMPLPVGLTLLQRTEGLQNWGLLTAATVIVTVPILVIFLVLQRRLVAGLTAGAVTG